MTTKADAGKKGGLTTATKYGSSYMASIGKRGAQATWKKYALLPIEIGGYAMVNRETRKCVATIGYIRRVK